jgi:hypothetical protein
MKTLVLVDILNGQLENSRCDYANKFGNRLEKSQLIALIKGHDQTLVCEEIFMLRFGPGNILCLWRSSNIKLALQS